MFGKSSLDLTKGQESKLLTKMMLPMIAGMVAMLLFNLVDTIFVGQLGTHQLAAMGFIFPITYIVNSIALGIGNGASAVVSRSIGQGDRYWVVRYSSDALMLAVFLVAIFLVIGFFTIDPLFRAMGAADDTMPYIREYMQIWYGGILFVVVPMVGNSVTRSTGDSKTPSIVMLTAVIINLILDPLMIFGLWSFPKMGVAGAAWATVISRAVTFCLAIYILYFRDKMISFKLPPLTDAIKSWKDILYVGLPSAGTSIIMPVSASILIAIVSTFGTAAVAGYGVATRVEAFTLTVMMALGSVLGPFIGQNIGAHKMHRVKIGMKFSNRLALVWGLIVAALMLFLGAPIGGLFDDNPLVIEIVKTYMIIVPISYGFLSIIMLTGVAFNTMHKPLTAAAIAILRMIILYIPLAYIGAKIYGLNGIFYAALISNFVAGALGYLKLRNEISKRLKKEAEENDDPIIESKLGVIG